MKIRILAQFINLSLLFIKDITILFTCEYIRPKLQIYLYNYHSLEPSNIIRMYKRNNNGLKADLKRT